MVIHMFLIDYCPVVIRLYAYILHKHVLCFCDLTAVLKTAVSISGLGALRVEMMLRYLKG